MTVLITTCVLTAYSRDKDGYGKVVIANKYYRHHRLVYCKAHNCTLDSIKGKVVMHTCDNPSCVNPDHLVLGTWQSNMDDKMTKGRHKCPVGSAHGMSRLTAAQVIAMRTAYSTGRPTLVDLATEYEISFQHVSDIVNRRSWKHI